ncbi:MAG: N-acetyl sugar amidotransferase [Actinobacteria bacterium]|nr:N-acetyl sugar amidotransferase [Actinomycetota bacterium]
MKKRFGRWGLPIDVKFCKKCVISNQRPSSVVETLNYKDSPHPTINFDKKGVCDACNFAEIKHNVINWNERERELKDLLNKYRSKNGSYDCIVPGSGGKDSIFTSHLLKYKYNMHPLTVTWPPHIYTEVGWRNFQHWIQSGFDNIMFSPNGKVHRTLTRLAFLNLCHPFQPFIIGQKNIAPKIAVKFNIPLIFYGEPEAEYGNKKKEAFSPNKKMPFGKPQEYFGGVHISDLPKYGIKKDDLDAYLLPSNSDFQKVAIDYRYLGYYIKWIPQESYYYSVENAGFEPNPDGRTEGTHSKYNSLDDRIDGFHYFTTYIKFGIGRASYEASQEIRSGHLTREEGVALVHRYDGEFPKKYFKEVLEYMDITAKQFWETIDSFRPGHLWKKYKGKWKLRHMVS